MPNKKLIVVIAAAGLSFASPAQAGCIERSDGSVSCFERTGDPVKVPEPGMFGLFGLGLAALFVARRKKAPNSKK